MKSELELLCNLAEAEEDVREAIGSIIKLSAALFLLFT